MFGFFRRNGKKLFIGVRKASYELLTNILRVGVLYQKCSEAGLLNRSSFSASNVVGVKQFVRIIVIGFFAIEQHLLDTNAGKQMS